MTITGAKEVDGKSYCEKCDADLSVEGGVQVVSHADGRETYSWSYKCIKCGNIITQTFKRSKQDMAYWK